MSDLPMFIGMDIGGTKIAAGVVDAESEVLSRTQTPTRPWDQSAIADDVSHVIENAWIQADIQLHEISAIGLGAPGNVDPERGLAIRAANIHWDHMPLVQLVEDRFGVPAFIENDVRAATLGELHFGAGKGYRNLVYLSVGTGIANGVVIHGRLYRGTHGMAGEIGHAVFKRHGPRCACGVHGCLEALASGPAMARRARERLSDGHPSLLTQLADNRLGRITGQMVLKAASQGDQVATEVVEEAAGYLAMAVLMLYRLYDPEIIVLGGGIAQAGDVILSPIQRELKREQLSSIFPWEHTLKRSELGSDAGILGAAAIAIQGIMERRNR